tara:strand:- start:242 stop:436 length:195 start_codon:yes stop_codon:yes gene_type:complete
MSVFVIHNFQKELKNAKTQLLEHLVQGGVENFEEYKYILGKIHMLDMCQQELSRLLDKEEKIDD